MIVRSTFRPLRSGDNVLEESNVGKMPQNVQNVAQLLQTRQGLIRESRKEIRESVHRVFDLTNLYMVFQVAVLTYAIKGSAENSHFPAGPFFIGLLAALQYGVVLCKMLKNYLDQQTALDRLCVEYNQLLVSRYEELMAARLLVGFENHGDGPVGEVCPCLLIYMGAAITFTVFVLYSTSMLAHLS